MRAKHRNKQKPAKRQPRPIEDRIRSQYQYEYRSRGIPQCGWRDTSAELSRLYLDLAKKWGMPCHKIKDICHRPNAGQIKRYHLRIKIMICRNLGTEWLYTQFVTKMYKPRAD